MNQFNHIIDCAIAVIENVVQCGSELGAEVGMHTDQSPIPLRKLFTEPRRFFRVVQVREVFKQVRRRQDAISSELLAKVGCRQAAGWCIDANILPTHLDNAQADAKNNAVPER